MLRTPGICGTDLHILHGAMDARVTLPAVLGHEMSGTIAAIGSGVSGRSVGERVTVMPLAPCGDCPACRAGYSHICHNLDFLGHRLSGLDAVALERVAGCARRVAGGALARACGARRADRCGRSRRAPSGAEEGERALVVGGGPIGLLVACVARARGADVVVVEPAERRRAIAQAVGLRAVDPTGVDVQAFVSDWTDGAGAEVAFEVSGAVAGIETAIQSLGVRGRIVVVAIHATAPAVNLFRVFWRELTLIGARVYERRDFEEAVNLLEAGTIPAAELITRIEPLEAVVAAFAELESGRAMKVLIDCRAGS